MTVCNSWYKSVTSICIYFYHKEQKLSLYLLTKIHCHFHVCNQSNFLYSLSANILYTELLSTTKYVNISDVSNIDWYLGYISQYILVTDIPQAFKDLVVFSYKLFGGCIIPLALCVEVVKKVTKSSFNKELWK